MQAFCYNIRDKNMKIMSSLMVEHIIMELLILIILFQELKQFWVLNLVKKKLILNSFKNLKIGLTD